MKTIIFLYKNTIVVVFSVIELMVASFIYSVGELLFNCKKIRNYLFSVFLSDTIFQILHLGPGGNFFYRAPSSKRIKSKPIKNNRISPNKKLN